MGLKIVTPTQPERYDLSMEFDDYRGVLLIRCALADFKSKSNKFVIDGTDYDVEFDAGGMARIDFEKAECWHNIQVKSKAGLTKDQRLCFWY